MAGFLITLHPLPAISDIPPVCALNMLEPIRAQALGGAGTAVGNDPTLIRMNPASISQVKSTFLTMSGKRGFFGDIFGHIQVVSPVGPGAAHLGGSFFQSPQIRLTASDRSEKCLILQQDLALETGYSENPLPGLSCGATVIFLNSRLFEETTAQAFALDFGLQYQVLNFLKSGLAIRHVGTGLKYASDTIPLPIEIRAGIAAGWVFVKREALPSDSLLCILDAVYSEQTRLPTWRAGMEYRLLGTFALRSGASIVRSSTLGRFSTGLGIIYRSVRLDYSFLFTTEFSNPHSLSVTITF